MRTYINNSIMDFWYSSVTCYAYKVAIEDNGRSYTYQDVEELSNQFAAYLLKYKTVNNDVFAIYGKKDVNYIACILALWKIACAFVPIDPELPYERIQYILNNAQISKMISYSDKNLFEIEHFITYDSMYLKTSSEKSKKILFNDDTAYIIYTSGSSGKPKGVEISNYNIVNFIISMNQFVPISEDDRMLTITTISFDISILEIIWPLFNGATVVIGTKRMLIDGNLLKNEINNNAITIMQATPITWSNLFGAGWTNQTNIKILCGGEKLQEDLAKKMCTYASHIYHLYGPTETTIWSSIQKLEDPFDIHLGTPILNTVFYVLNDNMQMVQEGELYIGGLGVAKGYYRQEELTKKRFVRNYFNSKDNIYKTGDLVRIKNGKYYYLGRSDFQVKINGHRIELEEIEQTALFVSGISEAVTVVDYDTKAIYLFVVGEKEQTTRELLRKKLENNLPLYMIPKQIIFVDSMPTSFNGKIDRKKLLSIFLKDKKKQNIPMNVLSIWENVLRRNIDPTKDFDNYVQESIKIVELCSEMFDAGILVGFDDIIRLRTVEAIQNYWEKKRREKISLYVIDNKLLNFLEFFKLNKKDIITFPISSIQESMLYEYYLNSGNSHFLESYTVCINKYDGLADRILEAIQSVTDQVEIMKTIYYYNKRGGSVGIYSQKLKLTQSTIYEYESDDVAFCELMDSQNSQYDLNKTSMEFSIFIGNRKIYICFRYHHIRMDMDSFYKLLCNIFEKVSFESLECDKKIIRNYFGDNKNTITIDKLQMSKLIELCKKSHIQLGVLLQLLLIRMYMKIEFTKLDTLFGVVLKDWKGSSYAIGNNIRVSYFTIDEKSLLSPVSFQKSWQEQIIIDRKYNKKGEILFIVNYVQKIVARFDDLLKNHELEILHNEKNGFPLSVVINIYKEKITITTYGDSNEIKPFYKQLLDEIIENFDI